MLHIRIPCPIRKCEWGLHLVGITKKGLNLVDKAGRGRLIEEVDGIRLKLEGDLRTVRKGSAATAFEVDGRDD